MRNTAHTLSLEQLVQESCDLAPGLAAGEERAFPRRPEVRRILQETIANLRVTLERMDQTPVHEDLLRTLARLLQEKRLHVRLYTRGRLQGRAYIFDTVSQSNQDGGVGLVGSSNLTLAALPRATDLDVFVRGRENHSALVRWFDSLWEEAPDLSAALLDELKQCWALAATPPYDIFMKTLYVLLKDRMESGQDGEIFGGDEIDARLADFQRVAVRQATGMIREHGGAFVADVVGLGKSYIGAAIVKHFERSEGARPLILCPAPLVEMWERYNEVYQLHARVLSLGLLRAGADEIGASILDDVKYRDRDFVLLDESHHFRHSDTQRYRLLQTFLSRGRKRCCFLTATPRSRDAWDVYHQLKLFHLEDRTALPINPPDLRDYFRLIDRGERRLQDLLGAVLIRRTRAHVLRWYGRDEETDQPIDPGHFLEYQEGRRRAYVVVGDKKQFFPQRRLETVSYSIEDTYQGLYQKLRGYLGDPQAAGSSGNTGLTLARYGLWTYVKPAKQDEPTYSGLQRAGANLRGLIRVLLFKRFESSVHAFRTTVRRLLTVHERFVEALAADVIPAGDEAQAILYEPNEAEENDLVNALREASGRYAVADFNVSLLREHVEHDLAVFTKILELVESITPERDAKLQRLRELLADPARRGKRLIFTQYADTAVYLGEHLRLPDGDGDTAVICGADQNKMRVVGRFAPRANPEYRFRTGEREISTLIATDVLAEGLNLQDCDQIINYDLHWNPVRLIQRFGRIDRIGAEHATVYGFNFLPETGLERQLGLRATLRRRIQEIHDTIGEDSAILDKTERLNEEALYAVYEPGQGRWERLEDEDGLLDLAEAEELLRQLQRDNPAEYQRITELRDGLRGAKSGPGNGVYVFCRAGRFQQLFLADVTGRVVSRDLPTILQAIRCGPQEPILALPEGHGRAVARVFHLFSEEAKQMAAEKSSGPSLSQGQQYLLRELQALYAVAGEEEKDQIMLLEKSFRGPLTSAVQRELGRIRRAGATGEVLKQAAREIYWQHNLREAGERREARHSDNIPRIVCSESLV